MIFRVATLNLEQDHKHWSERRNLIVEQVARLRPDVWALNEIHIPSQTGRWLQREGTKATGNKYVLMHQSKAGEDGRMQAEGLLTRFPVIETANLDYRSHECVALVARLEIGDKLLDVYVTHLIAVKVEDAARQHQASQLLDWMRSRDDADAAIACGDFNAPLDQPSAQLMAETLRPTQTEPTAFTPLREHDGKPTHPEWPRFDRCIDYIWVSPSVRVHASGRCFDQPAVDNPDLWPSDHVGVWADLEIQN
jgi:endonuclease/exonuclease/phosphatase family metal-dependent hydrolase